MKLALHQAQKIAIALALVLVGIAATAHADIYFYKDKSGVFRFTRTPVTGAKLLRSEPGNGGAPATTPSDRAYDHIIRDTATRYGVDAALVKAIIHAESTFQPKARSRAGARGLMQLLPSTAGAYGVASHELYEPRTNIHAGVRHLRSLLERFSGNARLAVAAYNAGAGAVQRHGGLPPFRETRDYVRKVFRLRARYGPIAAKPS